MVSIIKLHNSDQVAVIDDIDVIRVQKYVWYMHVDTWTNYVYRWDYINGKRIRIHLHRYILGIEDGRLADHKNHDGLDNTRNNLREATATQSCANRRKWSGTSSKYKGVSFRKDRKIRPWIAYIRYNYVLYHLGFFNEETEAALRYNSEAAKLFGEFAYLNEVLQQ